MSTSQNAFETKLNIYLSRILNENLSIGSISETRTGKKRPDILIYYGGIKIIIEGSYSKPDAEKDIKEKIIEGFGDIGLALQYVKSIPDIEEKRVIEILKKSKFNVKIFKPTDVSKTMLYYIQGKKIICEAVSEWQTVDIFRLSSLIEDTFEPLIKESDINEMIKEIEYISNDFVKKLLNLDKNKQIARKLYDAFYHLYGLHVGKYEEIIELIYAQSYLALLLALIFYQLLQPTLGINNLNSLISNWGKKEGLRKGFEEIISINYETIYQLSTTVIENVPDKILDDVIKISNELSSNPSVLKRDFSGKLYHKVVGNWIIRKGFATYFTMINSAYLLSYLSIFSKYKPFKDALNVKVCDFTCGSGTLLTTTYAALEDLYKLENFEEGEINLDEFHKKILENSIWGFDALRYAVQIASLNLVFHNPSVPLNHMNFSSIPLGINQNQQVELGSLRFLKSGTLIDYFGTKQIAQRESIIDTVTKKM